MFQFRTYDFVVLLVLFFVCERANEQTRERDGDANKEPLLLTISKYSHMGRGAGVARRTRSILSMRLASGGVIYATR